MSNKEKDLDLFPAIKEFHELINHFFEDPFTSFFHQPFRVNVYDMEKKLVVEAELPGFEENQIKIVPVPNGLKIIAEDNQQLETIDENQNYFKREQSVRRFERIIPIPYEISSGTKTTYKNGILEIHIPKK